jgi:riboflavin synthase
MFTGIIQEIGEIEDLQPEGGGVRMTIAAPQSARELQVNDSIAINGVCLTVTSHTASSFIVEAVEETLLKTTIGQFRTGRRVNLELAVRLTERLGGHMVQGHVDGLGTVTRTEDKESSRLITVTLPADFMQFIIPVGSLAIDGVSLTAARVRNDSVVVSVIPHTLEKTTLADLKAGNSVNIELDVIGKYVYRMLHGRPRSALTEDMLRQWGYEGGKIEDL